jgi:NADH dehydrogenase (ubiquinone) 1 alpha subcomplex subunit 9
LIHLDHELYSGAGLIAKIAAENDVSRFIHVSHLNADPNSDSALYRTKYEGELAVREAFPGATIARPGPLFGGEDWLLNAIACESVRTGSIRAETRRD